MEKRYQVFVSSTYRDLVEERREVIQALLELDCIPAGMEMFPAADADQWSLIQRVIDDCDYYVVIVGGRYGSTTAAGISYTEQEYDYAVRSGKPVLGFVHEDPDSLAKRDSEMNPEAVKKLEAFRAKVGTRLIRKYSTPEGLGSVVSRSLVKLIRDQPGEGWVKGRYAMTAESVTEVSELRAKLAELELEKATTSTTVLMDTTDLARGDEEIALDFIYQTNSIGDRPKDFKLSYTWDELFELVGPMLIDEANEEQMKNRIEHDALMSLGESARNLAYVTPSVTLTHAGFDKVKLQLRALNLIEKGTKRRGVTDKATYWRLTDVGDRHLVSLTAVRTTKDGAEPSPPSAPAKRVVPKKVARKTQ